MRVGVVVPTLNSAKTLEWTLLSLLRQEGCDVDVVVVDSHSTDGTLELCALWGVPVLQVPAGSMYRAINAGIGQIDTEWVSYLNSDDILYRDGLERLLRAADTTSAEVAYGQCDFIDGAGRFLYALTPAAPDALGGLLRRGVLPFAQPGTIFRREVFRRLGGFAELKYAADYDFFARALVSGARFVRAPAPSIAAFRVHAEQLSAVGGPAVLKEIAQIRATLREGSLHDLFHEIRWRAGNWDQNAIAVLRGRRVRRGPRRR
jgi:glycosyltransferase involved in cell wall biosynthesis